MSKPTPADRLSLVALEVDNPKDFVQWLLKPLNKLCLALGRKGYGYFCTRHDGLRLNPDEDYVVKRTDPRENFIPARLSVIADALLQPWKRSTSPTAQSELAKRADFVKLGSARFHYEALAKLKELEDSFAPFNPDADETSEPAYTLQEKKEKLEQFSKGLKEALVACNYNEIDQEALDRILKKSLPGRLPVKADYSSCIEYHVYVRGVRNNEREVILPSQYFGRSYEITSETIGRLCVFARIKNKESKKIVDTTKRVSVQKFDPRQNQKGEDADFGETIMVKAFKNVALEDLKMVAPDIKLSVPPFDVFKIATTFTAGTGSAVLKILLAATISLWAALGLIVACSLAMLRSFKGFINRRTHYMQRYARQLYFYTIASNFAAVNMLVTAGEEQEIKEFVLSYFTTLDRQLKGIEWSTEQEIDLDAENWLRDKLGLTVDFESDDALRKLREKNLLEEREGVDANGELILDRNENAPKRYRVKPLDEALRVLDKDWDDFFQYNV